MSLCVCVCVCVCIFEDTIDIVWSEMSCEVLKSFDTYSCLDCTDIIYIFNCVLNKTAICSTSAIEGKVIIVC